jgi:hypothetical protein
VNKTIDLWKENSDQKAVRTVATLRVALKMADERLATVPAGHTAAESMREMLEVKSQLEWAMSAALQTLAENLASTEAAIRALRKGTS